VGEVFAGRYELLSPIAEGGMGAVWRVRDLRAGEVRAAKLVRHSDAGTLLRFVREQSTRIHHPHVVTPLSWVGEDDTVLFTMPLVRGGSVADLVGDWGPLPESWVLAVVDQVLTALEAVHDAGVVHRDVKPANLLLEPTGRGRPHVRLTDFGIAATLGQPRLTTGGAAPLGTPGYAAPEQRAGADPDVRQDLWAVATVGLEMLVGHPPPFVTDEAPATPLGGLFVQARNPDPDRRPASAADFRSWLAPLLPAVWRPGTVEVLDQFDADVLPGLTVEDGRRTQVLGTPDPGPASQPAPPVAPSAPATPAPPVPLDVPREATPSAGQRDTARRPVGVLVAALVVLGVALLTVSALLLLA